MLWALSISYIVSIVVSVSQLLSFHIFRSSRNTYESSDSRPREWLWQVPSNKEFIPGSKSIYVFKRWLPLKGKYLFRLLFSLVPGNNEWRLSIEFSFKYFFLKKNINSEELPFRSCFTGKTGFLVSLIQSQISVHCHLKII